MADKLSIEDQTLKEVKKDIIAERKTKNLNPEGMYFFKPALHIDNDTNKIFVSVPFAYPRILKGIPKLETRTMVVKNHETFLLDEDNVEDVYTSKKLFPVNLPDLPLPSRWSKQGISRFLNNINNEDDEDDEGRERWKKNIFSLVKSAITNFLDLSEPEYYDLFTVYIFMTYVHIIFNEVPFINLTGFSGAGKSKVLAIFQQLCFNAESTVNTSPSALFRMVEQNSCTILIDEGEKFTGLEKDPDLRLLLNACYKKGGTVNRWNADNKRAERHYVYAPAIIAAINPLEPTLLSRCISIVMLRVKKDNPVGKTKITNRSWKWQPIRDDLYHFIFIASKSIQEIYETEDFGTLNCRQLEKWQPLLSIAKYFEKCGVENIYQNIKKLAEIEQEEENALTEVEEMCLYSINDLVKIGGEYLVKDIKKNMTNFTDESLENINNKIVASILRKFGFRTGKRKGTGTTYRISPDKIKSLYQRYEVSVREPSLPTSSSQNEANPENGVKENVNELWNS